MAGAQVFPGIGPWEETKMPRDVTTLEIWIRAAARSEARHLVMQAGVRRAGDLSVLKLGTKAGGMDGGGIRSEARQDFVE